MRGRVQEDQAIAPMIINGKKELGILNTGAIITATNISKAQTLRLRDIKLTKFFLTVGGIVEVRYHVANRVKLGEHEELDKIIGCYVPTKEYQEEVKRREKIPVETLIGMDLLKKETFRIGKGKSWELRFD